MLDSPGDGEDEDDGVKNEDNDEDKDEDDEDDLPDSEVGLQGLSEAGRRSLVGVHLTEQRVYCFPVNI